MAAPAPQATSRLPPASSMRGSRPSQSETVSLPRVSCSGASARPNVDLPVPEVPPQPLPAGGEFEP